jgi:hypothetical protein
MNACVEVVNTTGLPGYTRTPPSRSMHRPVKKSFSAMNCAAPATSSDYVRKNPVEGKIENKTAYWELHDNLIFKAGTYSAR